MNFWNGWIAEGDAAGDPETGEEWGWWTKDHLARKIEPGERFYIVAHGRLRGWAPVTRVVQLDANLYAICREGNAVACTIDQPIRGFRGLRRRWWSYAAERAFPTWKTP
jgi:hypothetical protein|tara:strand:+ start:443 stop:769 length:327 start_codon:yes stop_codon:yes gene_type:complete